MVVVNGYKQNENEKKVRHFKFTFAWRPSKANHPTGGFGYIVGGSEDEWTLRANRKAFTHKQIVPKALSNIENPELATSAFGLSLKTPLMMPPIAAQGLAHAQGEKDTAKGLAAVGGLMAQSTYSSTSIAETALLAVGLLNFPTLYE